jgi:5-methylcytosine-specific restriction enzyme B
MNLQEYLSEFKAVAKEWFAGVPQIQKFHEFFGAFFQKQNLKTAQWTDFQKLGDHIHSFQNMALAKKKALGNQNHPIEHYRKSLDFLVHGEGSIEDRIGKFVSDKDYKFKYFGNSVASELLG